MNLAMALYAAALNSCDSIARQSLTKLIQILQLRMTRLHATAATAQSTSYQKIHLHAVSRCDATDVPGFIFIPQKSLHKSLLQTADDKPFNTLAV